MSYLSTKTGTHSKSARSLPVIILTVVMLSLTGSCGDKKVTAPAEEIGVAVYAGRGADGNCITAAKNMFRWMGYDVEEISHTRLNTGSIDELDIICFPGGDMYYYARDITASGKANIKQFIAGGGGYIGICGGAYFAASDVYWRGGRLDMVSLSLFPGTASGPINSIYVYPAKGMTQLDIASMDHPITSGEAASISVLYYWGPYLAPNLGFEYEPICDYHVTGAHAMIAFDYGMGRVFLTGVHPEFEEDSDRDGVTEADEFDDDGSDWDFMKKAARWCLRKI